MASELRLGDLPGQAALRGGDREALTFKGQRWSFRQLAADIDEMAKGLIRLGVAPGDKVAIWLGNCPQWIHAMFAWPGWGPCTCP